MFFILEIQVHSDGTAGTIINPYNDKNEAESNYHRVLMSAAVSDLPIHTAYMLTDYGVTIKSEGYSHPESETNND